MCREKSGKMSLYKVKISDQPIECPSRAAVSAKAALPLGNTYEPNIFKLHDDQ